MTSYQVLVECGDKLLFENKRESAMYNHDDVMAYLIHVIDKFDYEDGYFVITTSQSGDKPMLVKRLFEVTSDEIHEYDLEYVITYQAELE